jgi:hypothetical protein
MMWKIAVALLVLLLPTVAPSTSSSQQDGMNVITADERAAASPDCVPAHPRLTHLQGGAGDVSPSFPRTGRYGVQVVKVAGGIFYILRVCYLHGGGVHDTANLLSVVTSVAQPRSLPMGAGPFLGDGMGRYAHGRTAARDRGRFRAWVEAGFPASKRADRAAYANETVNQEELISARQKIIAARAKAVAVEIASKPPYWANHSTEPFDVDTNKGDNRAAEENELHTSAHGHWSDARHTPITEIPPMGEPGAKDALLASAAKVSDFGRLVLFTTTGLNWTITAMVPSAGLVSFGFTGAFVVVSSADECAFILETHFAGIGHCAFQRWDDVNVMFRSRLWMLDELSRAGYAVVMADTDMCITTNPWTLLDAIPYTVITSGWLTNFTLGVVYANGRKHGINDSLVRDREGLSMLSSVHARMTEFTQELLTTRADILSSVAWDQNVFNDVMEEYVSGRPMYTRSCNFSGHMFEQLDKAAQGVCFNKCCETILTDKEFLVRAAEDNALLLAHPHVAGSTIGHCDNGFGFMHKNVCPRELPVPVRHWDWQKANCWPNEFVAFDEMVERAGLF